MRPARNPFHPGEILLEEFLVFGYTGSAGTHVPPDERRLLNELRALIDAE